MRLAILAAAAGWVVCAQQSDPVVAGLGYGPIRPHRVAPGQIVTLFVTGTGLDLREPVKASADPLPASLAGISVTLLQGVEIAMPILEVRPLSTCPAYEFLVRARQQTCGKLIGITVQIPFEIVDWRTPPTVQLMVSFQGKPGSIVDLDAQPQQIRILRGCEFGVNAGCGEPARHADGTPVTSSKPARPGEVVTVFAYGLGRPELGSQVRTGRITPLPAPVMPADSVSMDYRFGPNAAAADPMDSRTALAPLFAGMSPGSVGLYQVNLPVPKPDGPLPPCTLPGMIGPGAVGVQWNLSLTLRGPASSDTVGICVSPE